MDLPFLGENWITSLGGVVGTLGIVLEATGYYDIGKGMEAFGLLMVGKGAADKHVTKREVEKVKEQVQEVKQDVHEVKQDVKEVLIPAPLPPLRSR